jgi:hypothetical protein
MIGTLVTAATLFGICTEQKSANQQGPIARIDVQLLTIASQLLRLCRVAPPVLSPKFRPGLLVARQP